MKTMCVVALVMIAVVSSSGCGTICNFATGDPELYGGMQKDIEVVQTPRTGGGSGVSGGWGQALPALLVAADMGLSLVADTLTLPLAIYLRQNQHTSEDETVPAGAGDQAVAGEEPHSGGRMGAECQASEPVQLGGAEVEIGEKRPAAALPSAIALPTH